MASRPTVRVQLNGKFLTNLVNWKVGVIYYSGRFAGRLQNGQCKAAESGCWGMTGFSHNLHQYLIFTPSSCCFMVTGLVWHFGPHIPEMSRFAQKASIWTTGPMFIFFFRVDGFSLASMAEKKHLSVFQNDWNGGEDRIVLYFSYQHLSTTKPGRSPNRESPIFVDLRRCHR